MLEIDGSFGEGGGQIVRTSLTLSLATGEPFRMVNIRAGRSKPGLLKQHLTAVAAAAEIGGADVEGARLHSRELTFTPTRVQPGEYRFSIGTAGSATLVLQTVLPVLLTARGPTTLTLEGGTHNTFAPPFDFIDQTFLPLINRLGPRVTARLDRPGFYPAGGGKFRVSVQPAERLTRLDLPRRGRVLSTRARAIVSQLPRNIAERELKVIGRKLSLKPKRLEVVEETRSPGPGNVVLIEIKSEHVKEIVTAFGQRGVKAERVATRAADEAAAYLDANVPVGLHLADQLLVPLALGSGGSYLTLTPTDHTKTNIEVIRKFLDVNISLTPHGDQGVNVEIN